MKVFYDFKIFYNQRFGGPSRYFTSLIDSLIKYNRQIEVNAPFFKNFYLLDLQKKYPQNIIGSFIKNDYRFTSKLFYLANLLKCSIKFNQIDCDIHHPTYFGNDLIKIKKKPIILTIYDLIHEKIKKNFTKLDDKKILLEKADHIICISNHTKRDLIDFYNIDNKKITVIYPGFKNNILHDSSKKIKIITKKPFLLYVGTRNSYKNNQNLIKAYSQSKKLMNDFQIIFFGGGKFNKEEINFIESLNIPENKILNVNGDDHLLEEYYKCAKALIYPSLYEGFGIPPLVAMDLGCPVFSSSASCLPEIQKNGSIQFNPNSTEDIKFVIENNIYNDTNLNKKIQIGKKISKLYSWEQCSKQTFDIYKKFKKN